MMDPNLQKIFNANIVEIRKGILHTALIQAQDYLENILSKNPYKLQMELSSFNKEILKHVGEK